MMMSCSNIILLALVFTPIYSYAAEKAKHIPGVFIGATKAQSETNFTYGVEYEYKLNKGWGVGAVYEMTNDAHHKDGVAVTLASIYYHPNKNIRLGIGFGQERIGGHHPHNENLYRVSAAYDFHIKGLGIAPTIATDFVDGEEAFVVGIAITKPF